MTYDSLLPSIIAAAKKAGAFIGQERENFRHDAVQVKGLNDLVSYVDKSAEQLIVADLQQILPDAGYIVEENTRSGLRDHNWIVDPLDGTTNFVHAIPSYAVSIALEHKGKIVAGVVYEVSRDECFYATRGSGAFLNEEKIQVSANAALSQSLVATGFPVYNFDRLDSFTAALHHFLRTTHGVRRLGAASVDLCFVACGRFDAFYEYNLHPWDVAAGALIVEEAGGIVKDFSGGDNWLFGREIAASNGRIDNEFSAVIQKSFDKQH
jgi:myo-inositol-1(or 4)-monophosphatase